MAAHLARDGHDVAVYNRTASRALAWVASNGHRAAPTPVEAAEGADFVVICVGADDDVREVVLGEQGALAALASGAVIIDHTTASAAVARELAAVAAKRGIGFVDAPVSGGQSGAEAGTLTVMCGADDEAVYERVEGLVGAYARSCLRIGPSGSGQLAKMVNQICIAGLLQGLAEGLAFAERAGVDPGIVLEAIGRGAAQSWQMDNRANSMVAGEFDFGFAVELMRKDLALCLAEARRCGARLPVTALVDQFYAEVEQLGGRRWDTSSLIQLLR